MEKKEEHWGNERMKGYLLNVSNRRRRERKNNSTDIGVLLSLGKKILFCSSGINVQGTFLQNL